MPLDMPPNYNVSTQIKQRVEIVSYLTSTQVDDLTKKKDDTILDLSSFLNFTNFTTLVIKKDFFIDNSTWVDFIEENFDVTSKLSYTKTFKVKAKIKTVSNYTPKIIID